MVFSILLFVIAGFAGHGSAFWVAYVMTTLAYAFSAVAISLNFKHGKLFDKLFYGFPTIKWSDVYVGVVTTISIVCMLISNLTWIVPFVAVFVLSIVYVIIVAGAFIGKKEAVRIDAETKQTVQNMCLLKAEVNAAINKTDYAQLKKQLIEFSEAMRFSDPMSAEALLPLEELIKSNIAEIRTAISAGETEKAKTLLAEAEKLLKERNDKTKALKG